MSGNIPAIKLVEVEAFSVIGMSCVTSKATERKNGKIGKLFASFADRSDEIRNRVSDHAHGISIYPEGFSGFEKYEYLTCYRVDSTEEVPEGMTMRHFPSHQYAVVTHRGKLRHLVDSYGYFHSKWLPSSGYAYADQYDVQIYEPRFLGPDNEESELDIYIPVRRSENAPVTHPASPIHGRLQGAFIPVRDIHAAKSWYSRLLGLTESGEIVNGHLYALPIDGPSIILDEMPMWGGNNPDGPPVYQTPAFMLQSNDIKEAFRFMREQGTDLVTDIQDGKWFAFRDLDGNLLMICESEA